MKFFRTYKEEEKDEEPDEEAKKQDLFAKFKKISMDKNYIINTKIDKHNICCCKRSLYHDESMKFEIKANEENRKMRLFRKVKGPIIQLFDKTINDKISNIYDAKYLIGRNLEI